MHGWALLRFPTCKANRDRTSHRAGRQRPRRDPRVEFFDRAAWELMRKIAVIGIGMALVLTACTGKPAVPDLGGLYNPLAQEETPHRNPVILIPGLLGSKLVDAEGGKVVWGAFESGYVDPNTADGARLMGLPLDAELAFGPEPDSVVPAGSIDRLVVRFAGLPVELTAYAQILQALGLGGYRDEDLAANGGVNWGDRHFTCFQFDYDWRLDIAATARKLGGFIEEKRRYVQKEIERRFGIPDYDVRFDLVTHSMGGLVARYYLRYGDRSLPADGSLPEVDWRGARYVQRVVMVAPPNAGSLDALRALVEGHRPAVLLPRYAPALLGTMPSLYQLLPRGRHQSLLDEQGRPVSSVYSPELWAARGWGLADPDQQQLLSFLMPQISDPAARHRLALDHQAQLLRRAQQFAAALDAPVVRPASLEYFLIAGDAEDTPAALRIDSKNRLQTASYGPGDGVVLRASALLDERSKRRGALKSPIYWDRVFFLFADHLALTRAPAFIDNLLYYLLESQQDRRKTLNLQPSASETLRTLPGQGK